jgi:hypothetical protein
MELTVKDILNASVEEIQKLGRVDVKKPENCKNSFCCRNCENCQACDFCEDCYYCYGILNGKDLKYVVLGQQFTEEEYNAFIKKMTIV